MSGFRLVKAETYPLTPDLAREFSQMKASPTERPIKTARLKMLKDKAEAGNLVSFHWAKAKFRGEDVRVNGQHSSRMLSELNGNFPAGLMAHIDEYEVDGDDSLAVLFRQFDDPKSTRNTGEVAGAWQGLVTELDGVERPIGKIGIDGYWFYQQNIIGAPPSVIGKPIAKDDRYSLFNRKEIHPFLYWLQDLFSIKTPELNHAAVVAAMWSTFQANEAAARDFWALVARGGPQFTEGAPETLLDEWLKRMTVKATKDNTIKPANFYQACIFAWNARREDASPKAIKADCKKGYFETTT